MFHQAFRTRKTLGLMATMGALVLALTGCADKRGGPIAYSPANFGAPDAPSVVPLGSGYKIAPLDTLTIKVFKMPDLSGDFEVDLTGQISVPLIGSLTATNYTTAQLDEQLTERLGAKYLENPDVSVGVKSSTSRSVTIDGAVKTAGGFPVTGPVTLMQAVARAGGASPEANLRRVAIFRQIGGKRQAAAFDLTSIRRGEMEDPAVYAGDIVIVDGSSIKALQKTLLNSLPLANIFRPF
ncbi:MAG: polysaccharide export protein [Sphingomonas bacterium]|nr:polysaccharide export protein [Sphingomonas bacterium]